MFEVIYKKCKKTQDTFKNGAKKKLKMTLITFLILHILDFEEMTIQEDEVFLKNK